MAAVAAVRPGRGWRSLPVDSAWLMVCPRTGAGKRIPGAAVYCSDFYEGLPPFTHHQQPKSTILC